LKVGIYVLIVAQERKNMEISTSHYDELLNKIKEQQKQITDLQETGTMLVNKYRVLKGIMMEFKFSIDEYFKS
jgi:hypothetical protein